MKWLKTLAQLSAVTAMCAMFACTKSSPEATTPEGALEKYVKIAFNAKSIDDGKKLVELSTGEAREWISSLSENDFKAQFVDNHMLLQSMKTTDVRREDNDNVSLVYEITYRDGKGPQPKPAEVMPEIKMTPAEATYSIKKIAYLKHEPDGWKVRATKNVKTYIERKDALEIPPNPPGFNDAEAPKSGSKAKK